MQKKGVIFLKKLFLLTEPRTVKLEMKKGLRLDSTFCSFKKPLRPVTRLKQIVKTRFFGFFLFYFSLVQIWLTIEKITEATDLVKKVSNMHLFRNKFR